MGADAAPDPTPWHAAYPEPRATAATIDRAEVLDMIRKAGKAPRDFVLIDLRRADHEGGTVEGSLNLPAQSLYPSIPYLYNLFHAAGIKQVIWYCGSSRGRGTRAAAWFQDHINERNDGAMQSVALAGGIKGWAAAGSDFTQHVDGYDAAKWTALDQ